MYLTAFLKVTLTNFSECRTFWRELLSRCHGQSVPPTFAEIYRQRVIYKLSILTYKALHTGQPYYLADLTEPYVLSRVLWYANCHLFVVSSCLRPFLSLKLFVYLQLKIGILFLCKSAHLTVLLLLNPILNLTFSLVLIAFSHPHASASDLTIDYWCYIKTLIDCLIMTSCLHICAQNLRSMFQCCCVL